MEIKKKAWTELFQKVLEGKKNADLRLADFEVKEGDTLVLEEYDPKTKKYTGRTIKKQIKNLNKIMPTEFYDINEIKDKGFWLIELD